MNLTRRLSILFILVATAALAVRYAASGQMQAALAIAVLGGLWLAARLLKQGWIHSIALLFFTGIAGLGVLIRLPPIWMLVGLAAALAAWDLEYFSRRVRSVGEEEADRLLERQHLQRLGLVIGAGVLVSEGAILLRTRFTFGVGLIVALLAVLALSQAIGFLRRESD